VSAGVRGSFPHRDAALSPCKQQVVGSNPIAGSSFGKRNPQGFRFLHVGPREQLRERISSRRVPEQVSFEQAAGMAPRLDRHAGVVTGGGEVPGGMHGPVRQPTCVERGPQVPVVLLRGRLRIFLTKM
jgi:hypothetical protein